MGKHGKKKTRRDTAEIARDIVEQVTGEKLTGDALPEEQEPDNQRGRKGGLVGGPARAQKLTDAERRRIAEKAAKARWGKESQLPTY